MATRSCWLVITRDIPELDLEEGDRILLDDDMWVCRARSVSSLVDLLAFSSSFQYLRPTEGPSPASQAEGLRLVK